MILPLLAECARNPRASKGAGRQNESQAETRRFGDDGQVPFRRPELALPQLAPRAPQVGP
jgi:hypothetical protein